MRLGKNDPIVITDSIVSDTKAVFQLRYKSALYLVILELCDDSARERVQVLNRFIADNGNTVPEPFRIKANSRYLCFKVRHKLRHLPQDYCFSAMIH